MFRLVCSSHNEAATIVAVRCIGNGVAKQISDLEPRAIYTHCYDRALNLSTGDTAVKDNERCVRDADT